MLMVFGSTHCNAQPCGGDLHTILVLELKQKPGVELSMSVPDIRWRKVRHLLHAATPVGQVAKIHKQTKKEQKHIERIET